MLVGQSVRPSSLHSSPSSCDLNAALSLSDHRRSAYAVAHHIEQVISERQWCWNGFNARKADLRYSILMASFCLRVRPLMSIAACFSLTGDQTLLSDRPDTSRRPLTPLIEFLVIWEAEEPYE